MTEKCKEQEQIKTLNGTCPFCGKLILFPFADRVDVLLFGNWRKYHKCNKELNPSKREGEERNVKISKRR